MTLYMRYAFIFMLVVAPLFGQDDFQSTVSVQQSVQQEVVQEQDLSVQSKTFLNRCYEYRYYIMAGVGLIVIASVAAYLYHFRALESSVIGSANIEPVNPELVQQSQPQQESEIVTYSGEVESTVVETVNIEPVKLELVQQPQPQQESEIVIAYRTKVSRF